MAETVAVKVLFFGKARELVSLKTSELVVAKNVTKERLTTKLEEKFPELFSLRGCFILALNEEYVETELLTLSSGFCFIISVN